MQPDCGACDHPFDQHRPACQTPDCACLAYLAPLGPRGMGYPTEKPQIP